MAYCIAFSNDGATDVTRRYVRKPAEHGLPRTRCPEECLLWMMYEIRKIRRDGMHKPDQQRLRAEDEREERELTSYVAHSIARDMIQSLPGSQPNLENKAREAQLESTPFAQHQNNLNRDNR